MRSTALHSTLSCKTTADFPLYTALSGATELPPTTDSAPLCLVRRQPNFPLRTLLCLVQLNYHRLPAALRSVSQEDSRLSASATLSLARRQPLYSAVLYSVWCNRIASEYRQHSTLSCETADYFPLHSTLSDLTELAPTIHGGTLCLARRQSAFPRHSILFEVTAFAPTKDSDPLYLARQQPPFRCILLCLV
jgi:hypothetical protein